MPSLLTIVAVYGSFVGGVLLIGALLAAMLRLIRCLDAALEPPRRSRRDTGRAPKAAPDPVWWPRFEREFAEYVELLQGS
jgi:hypothetical protein